MSGELILENQVKLCYHLYNNEEVKMAVHKCLQIQEASLYHDGLFSFIPKWNKCMNVLRDCAEQ